MFDHERVWRSLVLTHNQRIRGWRRLEDIGVDAFALEQAFMAFLVSHDTDNATESGAEAAAKGRPLVWREDDWFQWSK